jgi:hypothetical protein
MNIAYLTQLTNLQISNRNPIIYLKAYDGPRFREIEEQHLLPTKLMEWAQSEGLPEAGLDEFIEGRTDRLLAVLQEKLRGVPFEVIDTR